MMMNKLLAVVPFVFVVSFFALPVGVILEAADVISHDTAGIIIISGGGIAMTIAASLSFFVAFDIASELWNLRKDEE